MMVEMNNSSHEAPSQLASCIQKELNAARRHASASLSSRCSMKEVRREGRKMAPPSLCQAAFPVENHYIVHTRSIGSGSYLPSLPLHVLMRWSRDDDDDSGCIYPSFGNEESWFSAQFVQRALFARPNCCNTTLRWIWARERPL